jgi:hypothetical protein
MFPPLVPAGTLVQTCFVPTPLGTGDVSHVLEFVHVDNGFSDRYISHRFKDAFCSCSIFLLLPFYSSSV